MNRPACSLIAAATLLLLLSVAARAAENDIARIAWLGGCWKSAGGEAGSDEHWMPMAGATMFGMSRTVKQGATVAHEFMEIRTREGKLVFIAHPSGKPSDSFLLLRMTDNEVVFENPQHEFPQRVAYKLESEGKLAARIEGMRNGNLRVIDFPMARVSCDARAQ